MKALCTQIGMNTLSGAKCTPQKKRPIVKMGLIENEYSLPHFHLPHRGERGKIKSSARVLNVRLNPATSGLADPPLTRHEYSTKPLKA